ncbi:MAG: class I SAM-dependent methyltransferase [Chloroflexi bacterium]|nr:class I SAM-dependent methyltransferase [Chloroflexota bacterium]
MNALIYRLMYWLGMSRWDSGVTPPEVVEAFQAGNIPPGPVIDLGCGTGTNVIYMAMQGRQAIGIDFVPEAISKAREKAKKAGVSGQTQFYTADVTRLKEMDLPALAFALDMGCFHGLSLEGQHGYIEGLAHLLVPGGKYMLYTLQPRKEAGISYGMAPEHVQQVFSPWFEIDRIEHSESRDRGSTWFWMTKRRS